MTQLSNVLEYDGFIKKFNELRKVKYPNLPEMVNEFVDQAQFFESANPGLVKKDLDRYALFNEVWDQVKIPAATSFYFSRVTDLNLTETRVALAYKRLEEPWIDCFENALDEAHKFIAFVELLEA